MYRRYPTWDLFGENFCHGKKNYILKKILNWTAGRCALVTSFGIFKYMAAYSLTQFVSVMICYNFGTNLSDIQFLYIDLFLITVFASCFGMTKPFEGYNLCT
jgi:magnesium-transporting ATPase (P-type)